MNLHDATQMVGLRHMLEKQRRENGSGDSSSSNNNSSNTVTVSAATTQLTETQTVVVSSRTPDINRQNFGLSRAGLEPPPPASSSSSAAETETASTAPDVAHSDDARRKLREWFAGQHPPGRDKRLLLAGQLDELNAQHRPYKRLVKSAPLHLYPVLISTDTASEQGYRQHFLAATVRFVDYLFAVARIDLYEQQYVLRWLQFIAKILTQYHLTSMTIDEYLRVSELTINDVSEVLETATICRLLRLTNVVVSDFSSLDAWGNRFWTFLHATSFVVQHEPVLRREFAVLLINFDMILPCNVCAAHYRIKDPLANLYVPIIKSGNPVGVLYAFHNIVNATSSRRITYETTRSDGFGGHRQHHSTDFPIEIFCRRYACTVEAATFQQYSEELTY